MENDHVTTRSPTWWTPAQDSGWDRAKAAFRRDWEQTKADFTGGRSGADLNQNVDDTLAQTFGKQPIPAETTINPMTDSEREAHVKRAHKEMEATAERQLHAAEKAIAKQPEPRSAHHWARWEDAELPLRYGHAAATHYGAAWDVDTEARLRDEWTGMNPEQRWEDVRETVRLGWGGPDRVTQR